MPQPNSTLSEAAARYADALIDLAEGTRGGLRGVERDMKALGKMLKASPELASAMRSPVLADEGKAAALREIGRKDGFHPLTLNFLGTVAQNGRARDLPDMVRAFVERLAEKRGTRIARVSSATKLSAAQLKQIKDDLARETGSKIEIEAGVDPELLGGFVVRIGSRLYDSSLRTQLDDMKLALKA